MTTLPSSPSIPTADSPRPLPAAVDVLVIGAGGAGYPGAFFLARAGRSVCMVDALGNLGGDCLAEGCVPSKAVREAALLRRQSARLGDFGLQAAPATVDWPAVLAHKNRVQRTRYTQHSTEIADGGVAFAAGRAELLGTDRARIALHDGGTHDIRFQHLILATGSAPARLPIPGAELAITSHDLFRLGADLPQPRHLICIGGGYIGVETASMLQSLGSTCTVLEYAPQLLPGFDTALAAHLQQHLAQRVRLELGAQVRSIARVDAHTLRVTFAENGVEQTVEGDAVLMATGRHAVLPPGVEHLGLTLDAHGHVQVDASLRTSNPRVWAPGDVNGRSMLFHSAVRQSLVAAHCIAAGGQAVDRMDFHAVPMTVFTEPELAHVGLTRAQAETALGAAQVAVTRYDYAQDARAQIYNDTRGFIQLVFDARDARLLGAQIAGMDAAQLIAPLALALEQRLDARALASTVFPHPLLSEGINKAAREMAP